MSDFGSRASHTPLQFCFLFFSVVVPLQSGAQDRFSRCMSAPSDFAQQENLGPAASQHVDNIQREIAFAENESRMSGMAGQGDRAMAARSRALQFRQQLQQFCAQSSQSIDDSEQRQRRVEVDRAAAEQANQTAARQREAVIEYELNRRVPGATRLMQGRDFWNWLNVRQGRTLRRDVWDQAIETDRFDRAAQMLRDYRSTLRSR